MCLFLFVLTCICMLVSCFPQNIYLQWYTKPSLLFLFNLSRLHFCYYFSPFFLSNVYFSYNFYSFPKNNSKKTTQPKSSNNCRTFHVSIFFSFLSCLTVTAALLPFSCLFLQLLQLGNVRKDGWEDGVCVDWKEFFDLVKMCVFFFCIIKFIY